VGNVGKLSRQQWRINNLPHAEEPETMRGRHQSANEASTAQINY